MSMSRAGLVKKGLVDSVSASFSDLQSAASKAYSANVRRMVIKDAMTNNLRSPPFGCESVVGGSLLLTDVVENEVKTHFRLKAASIREQLDK